MYTWRFALSLILLLFLLSFWGNDLAGQNRRGEPCHTMQLDSLLRVEHPELGSRADFEDWLARKQVHAAQHVQRQVYTIPVVVHIIHDGEGIGVESNISAARVQSQIQVLNEDFRRMTGTPGHNNDPAGADVEIEFCLATIAPDGSTMPEPGIDRVDRSDLGVNEPPFSSNYIRNNILPNTIWDPERYMNIWTVDIEGDVIGFAQLPNQSGLPGLSGSYGTPNQDGVVITVETFGRESSMLPPYNGGRTTTHEVGHFLGLYHVWGDGNCSFDDYCGDTPSSAQANYGCPSSANSCGEAEMVTNYMDYLDDQCMNTFTQCQKQRMRTVLTNSPRRANLISSTVCQGQLSPIADFRAGQSEVCLGQKVKFFDQSLYAPTSWSWSFPGGSPSTSSEANPEVTYTQSGTYDVTLTVTNALGTQSKTLSAYIEVGSVGQERVIFFEDFEAGLGEWVQENPDGGEKWEVKAVGGNEGSFAVGINLYTYASEGERDALISPPIDLSQYNQLRLSWEYAYRPYNGQSRDSLIVYASVDGGQTFSHRLYGNAHGGSTAFATGANLTTAFSPSSSSEWCGSGSTDCPSIDLSFLQGIEDVRLKFESFNDFGNNIYFDAVKVSGICSEYVGLSHVDYNDRWQVYPNPASGILHLDAPSTLSVQEVKAEVHDLSGRVLLQKTLSMHNGQGEISLQSLPKGYYLLRILSASGVSHHRILRQ